MQLDAYGIDVVSASEAIGALAESCTIVRRMWTEDAPFDFEGHYYNLKGAICEPKPVQRPHPPILIGAGGERVSLRVVAEHADIWTSPTRSPEEFRHKSQVLDEHCAAIGRDPAEIVRSAQILVSSAEQADPVRARDLIGALVDAGATHIILGFIPPSPSLRQLADQIVEPLLA